MLGAEFVGAEFVRGRVCQGPSLLGAEISRNPQKHENIPSMQRVNNKTIPRCYSVRTSWQIRYIWNSSFFNMMLIEKKIFAVAV